MAETGSAASALRAKSGTLRFRLTALATIVVAVILTVAAFAVLTVQRRQLTDNFDASLEQRADTIAASLATSPPTMSLDTSDDDRAIQLVAVDGRVLAASSNLTGEPAIAPSPSETDPETMRTVDGLPLEDDSYRVLSRRIETDGGPAVLHVAENSDDLEEAIRTLAIVLAISIPAVMVLLSSVMWWLTGKTLQPVERMREQVDSISATSSGQRVHVPDRDDEISRLGSTMNRMLDRLANATERERRFVADAAHELRTPLTRIRTNLEVDAAHPATADSEATMESIRQEAVGLQQLVDDLLHLARSDAGREGMRREPVDLDDILMQEIRDLRTSTPGPTIDASRVSAAHLSADPEQLRRAVRNVLANAVRHASSIVTIVLTESNSGIELIIGDDGPGIPVEHRETIFERFTRVQDARTRDDGGTGLGLAITRDIVEGHGGTITYEPEEAGARFVIRIPTA